MTTRNPIRVAVHSGVFITSMSQREAGDAIRDHLAMEGINPALDYVRLNFAQQEIQIKDPSGMKATIAWTATGFEITLC